MGIWTVADRGWRRTARRLLVGDRSGWVVGILAGATLAGSLLLAGVPDEQPFPLRSVGYWVVVAALLLPAVLGTLAGGGLLPGWFTEGLVGATLWWLVSATPPDADYIVYTSFVDRLWDVFLVALLFALLFGTGGYLIGRFLLVFTSRGGARDPAAD